ncbi:molybdate transporter 1 [Aristolochia californica]|uniref:molybdate transporter 1 n=1 Tax=Aristolochia californica TaxID=171875 RepID=UPI0035E08900
MGDLGTYIPIVLALTLAKDLNLGTTLLFTGIYNIITGITYGVPMPVQPMKSIAAVAISSGESFGIPEIMAAGICTGGVVFLLGITGLMGFAYRLIPLPVVRGIQLSQGLSFAMTAVKYVRKVHNFSTGKSGEERSWLGPDGMLLALVCVCLVVIITGAGEERSEKDEMDELISTGVLLRPERRKLWRILFSLPSAVLVFLLGIILAIVRKPAAVQEIKFGPAAIKLVTISKHAWKEGFIKGAIPQIPLSVLNSVIAVCKLSADLFPGKDFSATSVSVTVGLMNMVGCWFGAMPCCHGAGGLAGQYKFGGRSGGSVAILGACKVILGVVLGSTLVKILTQFPVGLLGVLLLFAGIELAMAARDMNNKEESFVMLVTTAVSLVASGAAVGFGCGIVLSLILKLRHLMHS